MPPSSRLRRLALLLPLAAAAPASADPPVNGCTVRQATNWLNVGPTPRHIDFSCCVYAPPCVKIKPGRTVRWLGDFSLHPLRPGLVFGGATHSQPGNPIPALDSGTNSGQITFPQAGAWGFYCNFHWNFGDMYGTVYVARFADGFETGDASEWSFVIGAAQDPASAAASPPGSPTVTASVAGSSRRASAAATSAAETAAMRARDQSASASGSSSTAPTTARSAH
jgi:plastocyanin